MSDVLGFSLELAKTYWKVWLEIRQVESQLNYDYATGFCSNCPKLADQAEYYPLADECCKDDPEYAAVEEAYMTNCKALLTSIKAVLGNEADELLNKARSSFDD